MLTRRVMLGSSAAAMAAAAGPGEYDVRVYGARGDGKANDTKAVQTAIDQCSRTGGRVVFPPGEYRTGMIRLKSHVTVELLNRAVWKAIPDVSLYPTVVKGLPGAFLFAENEQDLHITGNGTINGSGDAHQAFIPGREQASGHRPFGLFFRGCRNLSVTNVTLESSAYWMFRPTDCDDVSIRGIRIVNLVNFNNDGIDVVDCHRVTISDCVLDCEDDAICLKTYSGRGVQDVTITNCILSSHARVIKVSLPPVSGSVFNRIAVSNCVIKPSRAVKTLHPAQRITGISGIDLGTSTTGAAVTNVTVDNVIMDGVLTPIFLRMGSMKPPGDVGRGPGGPGALENISISNIRAVNSGPVPCIIAGVPGSYVRNVRLSNIDLAFNAAGSADDITTAVPEKADATPTPRVFGVNMPAYGMYLRHAKDIFINGMRLRPHTGEPRPEMVVDDVHGLDLTGLSSGHPDREKPWVRALRSTRIRADRETLRLEEQGE